MLVLEFENLKKISSIGCSFCFTLETVFKAMSLSLDPGTVWGNSAELSKFLDCGRQMPQPAGRHLRGRALEVHRTSEGS